MPLFFASNAICPIELMPEWPRLIAHGNPLSYLVDLLRALMVSGGESGFGLGRDAGVLGFTLAILVAIAARLYPTVIT